jgi:hypothetical protein
MSAAEEPTIVHVRSNRKERTFQEQWKFISDVKRTVDGAFTYKQSRCDKFKTGRDRYIIDFNGEDAKLIQSHYAMKLVSKTSGNDYMVCHVDCMDAIDELIGNNVPSTVVPVEAIDLAKLTEE